MNKEPVLKLVPRPNDTNSAKGDIFGGWLMAQIDVAGSIIAYSVAKGPIATIAVKELLFLKPIFVYDLVSFYGEVIKVGKSSITVKVEVFSQSQRNSSNELLKVSDATLVFVAISEPGKKRILQSKEQ